jgi:hypothetical protein
MFVGQQPVVCPVCNLRVHIKVSKNERAQYDRVRPHLLIPLLHGSVSHSAFTNVLAECYPCEN